MKIREVLTEAKARIEHPEDRIFDDGSAGAKAALESLLDAASSSKNISIKFDGTPALIGGIYRGNGVGNGKFVMTDKGGLAKSELPSTPEGVYHMLYDRKPDQPGRKEYSQQVSGLFNVVKKIIPKNFPGLIQFDVMWFSKPQLVNGIEPNSGEFYQFKPNKVLYNIPANSELGKQISQSQYGIVVHSYFDSVEDDEPRAITDFHALGLIPSKEIVVLNPKATFEVKPSKEIINKIADVSKIIGMNAKRVDDFLNPNELARKKISDLPALMKKFLAYRANSGISGTQNLQKDFWQWINSVGITEAKRKNILDYLNLKSQSCMQIWRIVSSMLAIKNELLTVLSSQHQDIQANIDGESSHEGYVVDAPSGKIKLVNRPLFMRK